MRASHNSQLQLQARSTRTCLSCLAPFGKFNYSKSHANELDGKVKQQTGRGQEEEKQGENEDSTENQTEKRVSNFQIAYRLRFLLFNLRWYCLFFATRANDIKSLTHTHTLSPYLCPSLLIFLPLLCSPAGITHFTWRYSASLANSIYVSNLIFCQQLENTKIFSPTRTVRSSS